MDIEERRELRERIERIEAALVERIHKSDQYLPQDLRSDDTPQRKYSDRINALRRLETAKLVNHYFELRDKWLNTKIGTNQHSFDQELASVNALDDEIPVTSLSSEFKLNSEKSGRRRFLCEFTEGLLAQFDETCPPQESYGRFVDLEPFYSKLKVSKITPSELPETYREYLVNFEKYANYGGTDLITYLKAYYDRAHYLGIGTGTSVEEKLKEMGSKSDSPTSEIGQSEWYCAHCSRKFANENVFKSHLSGRKHKRAAEKGAANSSASAQTEPGIEEHLHILVRLVKPAIEATIANIDRKAGMTLQDRSIEAEAYEAQREAEDNWHSDDGDSNAPEEPSQTRVKPLRSAEGAPIPRWLFKLRGLGTVFHCEICGPHRKYAGRKDFETHFGNSVHVFGLKRLGITPSPVFHGIPSVAEATELHKRLKRQNSNSAFEKEVEDDEGNALSERMYEDLKKQGLL